MSAVIDRSATELDAALAAILGVDELPEYVTTSWITKTFGAAPTTILYAIQRGKLPAERLKDADGKVVSYSVRPRDAFLLWGHRLMKADA